MSKQLAQLAELIGQETGIAIKESQLSALAAALGRTARVWTQRASSWSSRARPVARRF